MDTCQLSALVPFLTCVGFPLSAHLPVFDEHITNESDDNESEQEAVDRDDIDAVGAS